MSILLSRQNLLDNLRLIQDLSPNSVVAPCLKSNAYGHGLVEIATILSECVKNQNKNNSNLPKISNHSNLIWLTLSSLQEAQKVRKNKINLPVLILNSLTKSDIQKALKMDEIRLSLYSQESVDWAIKITRKSKKFLKIHLQIDTGMHWLGILPSEFMETVGLIMNSPFLELEGIWTHFASSENLENPFFEEQLATFLKLKKEIVEFLKIKFNFEVKFWHCANSGAILRDFKEKLEFNLVQPGKILYGSYTTGAMKQICQQKNIFLKPVLTWQTQIVQIKKLYEGDSVGYDQSYICQKDCQIAILPVGYFDGLNHKVSGQGYVLINGRKCFFVGRICMNMSMVLLPPDHNFKAGQIVTLIGQNNFKNLETEKFVKTREFTKSNLSVNLETKNQIIPNIPLGLIASWCGTIGREISTKLNPEIRRVYY